MNISTPICVCQSPASVNRRNGEALYDDLAATAASGSQEDLAVSAAQSAVQIQLGAYLNRSSVFEEWARISEANTDLLSDRALSVQKRVVNGILYHRLRVGPFRDKVEADEVCTKLIARGQDCLTWLQRSY